MKNLYPELDPFAHDWLRTPDGHEIYFEQSGNPAGVPVLFVHGGPGSSSQPGHRRFFDPARYHIVLFDQRGCGRSRPLGGLEANNTQTLIEDMERIRQRLAISRWLLFGGSWGAMLCVAYAQAHPARSLGLILRGIFLGSERELHWYLHGVTQFVPEAVAALQAFMPPPARAAPIAFFYRRVMGGGAKALAAAKAWVRYEGHIMSPADPSRPAASPADEPLLARARVQLHYLFHECFLSPAQLLTNIQQICHLPLTIVQGRLDLVCPPLTAHELHHAWPGSRLEMIATGGHSASHVDMTDALVTATDDFILRYAQAANPADD